MVDIWCDFILTQKYFRLPGLNPCPIYRTGIVWPKPGGSVSLCLSFLTEEEMMKAKVSVPCQTLLYVQ